MALRVNACAWYSQRLQQCYLLLELGLRSWRLPRRSSKHPEAGSGPRGHRHVSLYIGVALRFVRIAVETSTARANLRMFCSLVNVWVRCGVLVFLQRVIDGMINVW